MNKSRSIQHDLIFIMKITVTQALIMMILTSLVYAADLKGQEILDRKISIHVDDEEVRAILDKIEKQASVTFTYRSGIIQASKKVSLDVRNKKLKGVLTDLFDGAIEAVVVEDEILLRPVSTYSVDEGEGNTPLTVAFQVSGKVSDEKGEALPGVNVIEKGTTNGTVSDIDRKSVV